MKTLPRVIRRRRESELALQLNTTPAKIRRVRYLVSTGRYEDVAREELEHIAGRLGLKVCTVNHP